jgi:hypothetical protein
MVLANNAKSHANTLRVRRALGNHVGTEILVIFFLITPLMFLVNIGLLFKRKWPNSKALIILLSNSLFLGYFCIEGAMSGYLVQAFLVGSFFLLPYQVISLILASMFSSKLDKLLGRCHEVT